MDVTAPSELIDASKICEPIEKHIFNANGDSESDSIPESRVNEFI